jgi:katanin p60 ATPase-containing subunit A1
LRELANAIGQDIYTQNSNCRWSDIIGLTGAKQLVQEAVVMPVRYPQLFTGLLAPWKGVLLYGPPGTGKTMLARAVATECKTTFFNISASSVVSKFRGDSEKLVRVLFELARHHAPSTIFLDEIDSIMGSRDAAGEHEASRRMKTELLVQMDGLSKSDDLVFVLAASNHPWRLDAALLRRLEKRIHVPLPSIEARYRILHTHLADPERSSMSEDGLTQIAQNTPGYSGADLVLLCKEAAMRPVRRLMVQIREADKQRHAEMMKMQEEEAKKPTVGHGKRIGGQDRIRQAMNDPEDVVRKMVAEAPPPEVQLDRITSEDVLAALNCTKPAANQAFLKRYEEWAKEHGNGFSELASDDEDNTRKGHAEYE